MFFLERLKPTPSVHRALHLSIWLTITISEVSKALYTRWKNRGWGYWWATLGGFTVGNNGATGAIIDAECAVLAVIVLLDLFLTAIASASTPRLSVAVHMVAALLLAGICCADMALFFGAAGARVSLPLILFAFSESGYVLHVAQPYLHVLIACLVLLVLGVAFLGAGLLWIAEHHLPKRGLSLKWKLAPLVVCLAWLGNQGSRHNAGTVNTDMLGQIGTDTYALAAGTLYGQELEEALTSHRVEVEDKSAPRPPLLVFHWEAASALITKTLPGNRTAVPYVRGLVDRKEAELMTGIVSVPMTLKAAWEVICGMPPAYTSDFREQGSALRRECLPRVLARCCGYHSILAKTDSQLPDMPKRVFGFTEVIVAPSNEELLVQLHARLAELGALEGEKPVFVYFYAGDAHAPYPADRVSPEERGYVEEAAEDVFLALHRRTDDVAERLAQFWPPRPPAGAPWRKEHGFAIYFGDHGELLDDSAAHGNSLSTEVTRVFMALEHRAFVPEPTAAEPLPRRLADIFSTVATSVGLRTSGLLHVGRSMLHQTGHKTLSTFSFYRPSELGSVHVQSVPESEEFYSWEFARSGRGWALAEEMAGNISAGAIAAMHTALAEREEVNGLITRSNVHAAWLVAKLKAAAKQARAAARALATLLFPALPSASK